MERNQDIFLTKNLDAIDLLRYQTGDHPCGSVINPLRCFVVEMDPSIILVIKRWLVVTTTECCKYSAVSTPVVRSEH